MQTIERTTLTQLVTNEEYTRKVLPFLKGDYFSDKTERTIFEEIEKFLDKYNSLPTKETLTIGVDNRKDITDEEYKKVVDIISSLDKTDVDLQWLHDETEKFCKDKAIYNAVLESISIIDNQKETQKDKGAIPEILSDALSVSYERETSEANKLDDTSVEQESSSVQVAYTMGGMTIALSHGSHDNNGYVTGANQDQTLLAVTMAF